ncbi:MAG: GNAT family N-acetyltransferase [Vulcanimicrobiota bacterium]
MDPWIRLGRTYESALQAVQESQMAVAFHQKRRLGFILWTTCGLLNGYIRTIAVEPAYQGRGLGQQLVAHAEHAILKQSPNVFLCVSSFNGRARQLYERLGYEQVGCLTNFVIPGHDEFLMRKAGPSWKEFRPV